MNLTKKYTNRMMSAVMNIKDVQAGMRVQVYRRIDFYNDFMNKSKTGKFGTVIGTRDCDECNEYIRKRCSQHRIVVKLDREENVKTDTIVNSCEYTFQTLQGYRIVSEGEYMYGGGKKL